MRVSGKEEKKSQPLSVRNWLQKNVAERGRTSDLLLRRETLYPLSYGNLSFTCSILPQPLRFVKRVIEWIYQFSKKPGDLPVAICSQGLPAHSYRQSIIHNCALLTRKGVSEVQVMKIAGKQTNNRTSSRPCPRPNIRQDFRSHRAPDLMPPDERSNKPISLSCGSPPGLRHVRYADGAR